jgi:hypothetical protein
LPSGEPRWQERSCQPFTHVTHITHLSAVPSLLRDGQLRAALVTDESLLTNHRVLVNWMSPNDWNRGSMYGNVEFAFDINRIAAGMRIFWVEATVQKVTAVRFLVTPDDRTEFGLVAYDPRARTGPWWYDAESGTHYRNGNFTVELLVERDILFSEAAQVSFTAHNDEYCALNKRGCPDLALKSDVAEFRFLALIVGEKLNPSSLGALAAGDGVHSGLMKWWNRLAGELLLRHRRVAFQGPITGATPQGLAQAQAVLAALGRGDESWRTLAGLFSSIDALLAAVRAAVAACFNVDAGQLRDPE